MPNQNKKTDEQCVVKALQRASVVCPDPYWTAWAKRWLAGTDRSAESARATATAMTRNRTPRPGSAWWAGVYTALAAAWLAESTTAREEMCARLAAKRALWWAEKANLEVNTVYGGTHGAHERQ